MKPFLCIFWNSSFGPMASPDVYYHNLTSTSGNFCFQYGKTVYTFKTTLVSASEHCFFYFELRRSRHSPYRSSKATNDFNLLRSLQHSLAQNLLKSKRCYKYIFESINLYIIYWSYPRAGLGRCWYGLVKRFIIRGDNLLKTNWPFWKLLKENFIVKIQ